MPMNKGSCQMFIVIMTNNLKYLQEVFIIISTINQNCQENIFFNGMTNNLIKGETGQKLLRLNLLNLHTPTIQSILELKMHMKNNDYNILNHPLLQTSKSTRKIQNVKKKSLFAFSISKEQQYAKNSNSGTAICCLFYPKFEILQTFVMTLEILKYVLNCVTCKDDKFLPQNLDVCCKRIFYRQEKIFSKEKKRTVPPNTNILPRSNPFLKNYLYDGKKLQQLT
eukprot:TRINITY_DN11485_c0_g1_i10.p1 TRINITY_DN11485_c0_g1~~TRINITY_DN11485_c0_g1_i10.p1  ORF type:complete len:224 (+),score=0.63 TRINITY_DN11485_c0_g1_i10:766-1437(+)